MKPNKCYFALTMLAGCLAVAPAMAQTTSTGISGAASSATNSSTPPGSTGTVGGTTGNGKNTLGAPTSSPESGSVGANVNSTFASGGETNNASGIAPASVTVPLSPASNSPITSSTGTNTSGTIIPGTIGTNTSCPDEAMQCTVPPG